MDWETGIEFGRAIERLASHETRLSKVEETQQILFKEIKRAKLFAARAGLVVLLWGGGLIVKLPAETHAEITISFLKALLKL